MRRKILWLVVVICMLAAFTPWVCAATVVDSGTCGDNLTWTLDDEGTLTISGKGAMRDYDRSGAPWSNYYKNIQSVIIENGVATIGDYAFQDSGSLMNITIPDSVINIGVYAFANCYSLTSITIPNSVGSIGDLAFDDCSGLTDIAIGTGVIIIGDAAFQGCIGLTNISIPDSVMNIGDSAFQNCVNLTNINVDNNNKLYSSINGVLFNKSQSELICCPEGKIGEYTIPDSVTSIGRDAFYGCRHLTKITISEKVTNIGESAFLLCEGLTSIIIPDSVTSINDYAFEACSNLTHITIPDSVMSIGDYTFTDCIGLTSVTIGSGVSDIGSYVFWGCENLTSINVNDNNESYSSINGVLFNKSQSEIVRCPEGQTGAYAIPDSVMNIGDMAFYQCDGLTSITIPGSVIGIGEEAFCGCSSLTKVTIPNGVTNIRDNMFQYCENLISVVIPNSITSIGRYAFYDCNSLAYVDYNGTKAQWESITIGSGNEWLTNAEIYFTIEPCFIVSQVNDGVEVTNTDDEKHTSAVIIAEYENGVLKNITSLIETFTAGETKAYAFGGSGQYRVFVWDSLKGMQPLNK